MNKILLKEQIIQLFIKYKVDMYNDYLDITDDILKLIPDEEVIKEEEKPILIGYLNRIYGFNGLIDVFEGHPVFEFKDRYFFEMETLDSKELVKKVFYKEDLKDHIKFL